MKRLSTSRGRLALAAILIVMLGGAAAAAAVPSIRWRVQVLGMHLAGQIPDVSFDELVFFVRPDSGQDNLARLISTRNPYAVIRNPKSAPQDAAAGSELFRGRCAVCHGMDASGGPAAPTLINRDYTQGDSDWAIFRTIRQGVPGTAMVAHPLQPDDVWRLIAYIRSVDMQAGEGEARVAAPALDVTVPYEDLRNTQEPAEDWLTYSGSYSSTRRTVLASISPQNVSRLAVRWIHQLEGAPQKVETSPVVRDGVMFITAPPDRVLALDAGSGKTLWTYAHKTAGGTRVNETGALVNRGAAVLDDKVFVGTSDARIVALSTATGKPVWETPVTLEENYTISAAPLAYRDLVVTGVATQGGGRAFVVAFDANTGQERWRFMTIPAPGEPDDGTWAGDSWKEGGAPTWLTGSYDADLDLLYWGVGNPKPDYDKSLREGDNLYSNSVVALRGATGELVWYFQFTPADDHDWDSNQIPVLADVPGEQGIEKRLLFANRNGFYYVLNRESGKFLGAKAFVGQTWTDGIDDNGRPLPLAGAPPDLKGLLINPGNVGGTSWWSPSYDPDRRVFFVPVLEQSMVFFPTLESWPRATGRSFYTAIRALNDSTGELVWERRHSPRTTDNDIAGVMSTKTGLLFGADQSTFFALDTATGQPLWSIEAGGKIWAAPVSYSVDGEQFVAVTAGGDLLAFALPRTHTQ